MGGVKDMQLATNLKTYQTVVDTVYRGSSVIDAERLDLRSAFSAVK